MTSSALLVADDTMLGELSAYLLRRAGLEAVIASSTRDALHQASGRTFDLLVVHASEFRAEWAAFVRAARGQLNAPILVVVSAAVEPDALAAYEAGADDYLSLPPCPSIFLAKVRAWLRHAAPAPIAPGIQLGGLRLDPVGRRLQGPYASSVKLSVLESRVLHLFMAYPGEVFPTGSILERVWGCSDKEDAALVKNVIYRLRRKIEAASDGDVRIETVPGSGYVAQMRKSRSPAPSSS